MLKTNVNFGLGLEAWTALFSEATLVVYGGERVKTSIHATKFLIGHFLPLDICTKNYSYPYPTCNMVFVRDILNTSTSNYTNAVKFRDFKPYLQKFQLFVPKNIIKVIFDSILEEYIFCRTYWCKSRKKFVFTLPRVFSVGPKCKHFRFHQITFLKYVIKNNITT